MAGPDEYEAAQARAEALLATQPTAVAARYDGRLRRVVVRLSTGLDVAFAPGDAQGLEEATPHDLSAIEITPSGLGLHFPKLDADLYLPALLDGWLGSRSWSAERLVGQRGKSRSRAKAAAPRANDPRGRRRSKTA
jgi:hypothetical protein